MPRFFGILFGRFADQGWSEVYPILAADYNACAAALSSIFNARIAMMNSDASFIGARISDSDIKGDSFPTGLTIPSDGSFTPGATYNPQIALRLLMSAGPSKRGSRWVRAIPDGNFNAQGGYVPTAGFTTALNAYIALLISSVSVATKIKGAVAPPFYTFTAITGRLSTTAEKRNIGRPFGLPVGRRVVA